ncbi:uroporphyrinogen-III C-methyltransferase [Parahaliea aestuarii]|uniref:Uroporphyrinogen III n=1 Tax=Parahaliea aestuarii TaxID=1852021 RepID=A0A5C8ZPS3_9GAMM|nr:uroporphyrinogen-III C-methyltransferase [Parahaliea aestuarii]TXS90523.1 uroporphyrinogen III [Parahaliea aestuarii]
MSDKDNDKAAPESPAEKPEAHAPAAVAASDRFDQDIQPARGGFPVLATFVLLLLLALAGACAWIVLEAQRREAALLDRLALLESVTEREVLDASEQQAQIRQFNDALKAQLQGDLRSALAPLEPRLAQQADNLQSLSQQLSEMQARVAQQGEELARFNATDREGWLLAEAEYLLRLANQRLIMTGDSESARALLRSADSILRQLDDTRLHDARAAIASELASLRAVPALDVEGLYLRLSALAEQAASLAIFELPEAEQRLQEAPAEDWRERLRQGYEAALQKLSDYIIIRRREVPMQALMDPQWEGLVRQNLRMLIEQAQVALLSGNARLYRESLLRARHWVEQFADSDTDAARALDAGLQQLADETVTVSLPDIGASLRALEQAIEQRKADADAEGQ